MSSTLKFSFQHHCNPTFFVKAAYLTKTICVLNALSIRCVSMKKKINAILLRFQNWKKWSQGKLLWSLKQQKTQFKVSKIKLKQWLGLGCNLWDLWGFLENWTIFLMTSFPVKMTSPQSSFQWKSRSWVDLSAKKIFELIGPTSCLLNLWLDTLLFRFQPLKKPTFQENIHQPNLVFH